MFNKTMPKERLASCCLVQNRHPVNISYRYFQCTRGGERRKVEASRFKVLHKFYIHPDSLEWPRDAHICSLPTLPASSPTLRAITGNHLSITYVHLHVIQSTSLHMLSFSLECPLHSCSCGKLLYILQKPHHRLSPPEME